MNIQKPMRFIGTIAILITMCLCTLNIYAKDYASIAGTNTPYDEQPSDITITGDKLNLINNVSPIGYRSRHRYSYSYDTNYSPNSKLPDFLYDRSLGVKASEIIIKISGSTSEDELSHFYDGEQDSIDYVEDCSEDNGLYFY